MAGDTGNSTLDHVTNVSDITTNNTSSQSEHATFIPSSSWIGSKIGYYFTTSRKGTGYYIDPHVNNNVPNQKDGRGDDLPPGKKRKTGKQLLEEAEATLASLPYQPKTINFSTNSSPSDSSLQSIKSSALSLEKAISKNALLRAQYPTQPEKFMESELALHEEITSLKACAAIDGECLATCYITLVELGIVDSLVQGCLGGHENVDVSLAVIGLFVELLDPMLLQSDQMDEDDNLNMKEKKEKGMGMLACSFIGLNHSSKGEGGLESTVGVLSRLKETNEGGEKEEEEGIDDVLSLVENLIDLDRMGVIEIGCIEYSDNKEQNNGKRTETVTGYESIAAIIAKSTTLVSWLFTNIGQKCSNAQNIPLKLHMTEILTLILQHEDSRSHISRLDQLPTTASTSEGERKENGSNYDKRKQRKPKSKPCDGMEILLQTIATYRKTNPESEEECECLENNFDTLAASLLNDTNVECFLEKQGIELMLRCLREKVHAGYGAMKVIFFALSGSSTTGIYENACNVFLDAGGLKVIFPIFMGRGSVIPKPARCSDAGNIGLLRKYAEKEKKGKKPSKSVKRALEAKREWLKHMEYYSIQIVYTLTRHINDSSPLDAKARLIAKFIESDYEKCNRLIELFVKYDAKMRLSEYKYYKSDEAEIAEDNRIDLDLAALNAKLKGGGDLFYRLAVISAFAASGSKRCHKHMMEQFKMQNSGIGGECLLRFTTCKSFQFYIMLTPLSLLYFD